jgi:predicted amidohydrolase
MGAMNYKVAAVAWKLRPIAGDAEFFAHLFDFVNEAHRTGANVLVLPELFVLELIQLVPEVKEVNVAKYLAQYADPLEEWLQRISESSGMIIVGGSHFKATPDGIMNVCAVAHPQLGTVSTAKNNLTHYEKEIWDLLPGTGLTKFPESRIGVTICYDCEFPESGRALAESGVLLQCVPAYTETSHGFSRVRYCCHARAIENQVFVAHSSLIGDIGREPVPTTKGSSAILCPAIGPYPAGGCLAKTTLNQEGIAMAELNFDQLLEARQLGDVRNWHDRANSDWQFNIGG